MAAATATLTVYAYPNGSDNTQRRQRVFGIAALTGDYATGGVAINFKALVSSDSNFVLDSPSAVPASAPQFYSVAGSGYIYQYNVSTGKLQIFTTGTASGDKLNEFTNGSAVPSDTVEFAAEFARGF